MDVNNNENTGIVRYANLLSDIKTRIRQAQVKATLSANAKNQDHESFLPQHVAKSGSSDFSLRPDAKLPLGDLILSIPWGHHALLMEKLKDNSIRFWYMAQIIQNGWSRYAIGGINKPLGISEYELTRALPENLRSSLPSIEELEAELSGMYQEGSGNE